MLSEHNWDYEGVLAYIERRGFAKVALQFPDQLLSYAQAVYHELVARLVAAALEVQVYLLADTTFNSLAVDEVAAAHVQAHCIIHYGHASLNPVSRVPVYFVLPRWTIDTDALLRRIQERCEGQAAAQQRRLLILFDLAYIHARSTLAQALQHEAVTLADVPSLERDPPSTRQVHSNTASPNAACCSDRASAGPPDAAAAPPATGAAPHTFPESSARCPKQPQLCSEPGTDGQAQPRGACCAHDAGCTLRSGNEAAYSISQTEQQQRPVGGMVWDLPSDLSGDDAHVDWLWVGPRSDSAALQQLLMTYSDRAWCFYDPEHDEWSEGVPAEINRRLMRRYYLVEKARNAAILGVLVGTLSMTGYLSALRAVRELAAAAGKKSYTMLMGKPNPAKLANFPEVEIWVQIADSQDLIVDCKEYFAPIVTPYEAYLALTDQEWDASSYSMDISALLDYLDTAHREQNANGSTDRNGTSADSVSDQKALTEARPEAHELAVQADRALTLAKTASDRDKALMQVGNASEYLVLKRTYQGLECPLVGSEAKAVEKAVEGRSGRAAGYANEPQCNGEP